MADPELAREDIKTAVTNGSADIVIGIASYNNARTIGHVVRAVDAQFSVPHALVMALVQEPLGHHAAYRTDRPGHRDRRSP